MEKIGSGKGDHVPGGAEPSKEQKLAQLRRAIKQAEFSMDVREARLLDAELEAVESDQPFDREREIANLNWSDKKDALAQLQQVGKKEHDRWNWDGVHHGEWKDMSYDKQFNRELGMMGYSTMRKLIAGRAKALKRNVNALDLFGGAYFVEDFDQVSHLLGVRLQNTDDEYIQLDRSDSKVIQRLKDNPKRDILEGNLFTSAVWKQVQAYEEEKGIHGFDVIVCRPQGAFGYNSVRNYIHTGEVQTSHDRGLGEIYRTLLTRGLNLMSAEDGLFFLQLPKTGIDEPTLTAFWKEYQQEKEKEGYDFYFNESRPEQSSQVLIRRRPVQKDAAERMG